MNAKNVNLLKIAALFCATCAFARENRFPGQRSEERTRQPASQQTEASAPAAPYQPATPVSPATPPTRTPPAAPPQQMRPPQRTAPDVSSAERTRQFPAATTKGNEPTRTFRTIPSQPQVSPAVPTPTPPPRSTSPVTIDRVERPSFPTRLSGSRTRETPAATPPIKRSEPAPQAPHVRPTPTPTPPQESRRIPETTRQDAQPRTSERPPQTTAPAPAENTARRATRPAYDAATEPRAAGRNTSTLHFSSSAERSRATPESFPSTMSLRTHRPDVAREPSPRTRGTPTARHISAHEPSRASHPVGQPTPERRTTLYRAPDRLAYAPRPQPSAQPVYLSPVHRHRPTYYFDPWTFTYQHHAFTPVWYSPAVYPASGFGFSWSSRSLGISFSSYSHVPTYTYTRYYNSWHCGGLGYSSVYYGGWRSGWYGGFSYVYNPWPVYRTYYLYDPYPVVTRTETVYITQPATTTYIVQEGAPAATAITQQAPPPATATAPGTPAAAQPERAEPAAECFCACHCNARYTCTCDYPCGSEYTVTPEAFNLSLSFVSYAATLNPETIWVSYAGLDRWDSDANATRFEATAAADPIRH